MHKNMSCKVKSNVRDCVLAKLLPDCSKYWLAERTKEVASANAKSVLHDI